MLNINKLLLLLLLKIIIKNSHNISIKNLQSLVMNTTAKIQADITETNSSISRLQSDVSSQQTNCAQLQLDFDDLVRCVAVMNLDKMFTKIQWDILVLANLWITV